LDFDAPAATVAPPAPPAGTGWGPAPAAFPAAPTGWITSAPSAPASATVDHRRRGKWAAVALIVGGLLQILLGWGISQVASIVDNVNRAIAPEAVSNSGGSQAVAMLGVLLGIASIVVAVMLLRRQSSGVLTAAVVVGALGVVWAISLPLVGSTPLITLVLLVLPPAAAAILAYMSRTAAAA